VDVKDAGFAESKEELQPMKLNAMADATVREKRIDLTSNKPKPTKKDNLQQHHNPTTAFSS